MDVSENGVVFIPNSGFAMWNGNHQHVFMSWIVIKSLFLIGGIPMKSPLFWLAKSPPKRSPELLNVAIHNLPHFRVSSKHVAGSISEGVMCLTLMLCRYLSRFWPKTWLLNFWAATGVPSLLNESYGTEPGNWTHWEKFAGSLKWNELPQQQRASSNTSL